MRRSDSPFLSIIVPMYNSEEFICDTLESVKTQDFDDYEIIIVDDGSKDNSLRVAEDCAAGDDRIIVLNKENGGQSSARNLGMKNAEGEYILFLDSDDKLEANELGKIVKIVKSKTPDILRGKLLILQGNEEDRHDTVDIPNQLMSGKERLIHGNISYSICAHIYRRKFLEENRITFIEGVFHEDMDFIVRAYVFADKVVDMDEFFYLYYMRPGSTTHMISPKRVFDYYEVAESVMNLAESSADSELYEGFFREYLAFLFSRVINMCVENKLPIKEMMSEKNRRKKIIFCLSQSRERKYRFQATMLKYRLYGIYSLIYQIRKKEKENSLWNL